MRTEVRARGFDPWAEIAAHQAASPGLAGRHGATACFVGTMRDFNQGEAVQAMTLEHYPGMTEKYLHALAEQAARRWDVLDALIVHRVGRILPNEPIVVVAVWAAHRAAAFEACRYLMEALKSRAPFWKKETLDRGEHWVEYNTPSAGGLNKERPMTSTLTAAQIGRLKQQLAQHAAQLRAEIAQALLQADSEQYGELAGRVHDPADEAVADLLADLNIARIDQEMNELREVSAALRRIAGGSYGVCIDCGDGIDYERLEAQPTALRCFSCQAQYEKTYAGTEPHTTL